MPSATQRRLAHQKLRKDLGIADKEYKSLMHSLLIEQSEENVRLDSVDAVKAQQQLQKNEQWLIVS